MGTPGDFQPTRDQPRAVIIGYGRVGRLVAEMMALHDRKFVAVDSDVDAVATARREGVPVIFGDASRPEFLDRLNLGHASALILTMDDPVQTVRLVKKVRGWCPELTIVARARDPSMPPSSTRPASPTRCPKPSNPRSSCPAVLVDLGMAMGPVIASIHEKRAELRQQIMEMGQFAEEPTQRGRRLGDALKFSGGTPEQ